MVIPASIGIADPRAVDTPVFNHVLPVVQM